MKAKSTSSTAVEEVEEGVNSSIHLASATFSFLSTSLCSTACSTLLSHCFCFHLKTPARFTSIEEAFDVSPSRALSKASRISPTCRLTARSNSFKQISRNSPGGLSSILRSFFPRSWAAVGREGGATKDVVIFNRDCCSAWTAFCSAV